MTIGLDDSAIHNSLWNRGASKSKASDFLEASQDDHILLSDPIQSDLKVRFPILLLEGQGFAAGTNIYTAENQTAVAGSCMVNLLQRLTDPYNEIVPKGEPKKIGPLAFSVCTQGTLIEFYVHYSVEEENITHYHMKLLMVVHASFPNGVRKFLLMVEKFFSW
ncbi:uncharacterized protein Z519_05935 [Cladophialophora bantiana CBS 173.52]|uniref:DUF7924 domain-containing protein n=1 Tax=Cladophialophora bantiana (strain ATCC 10958 / CBS 173.52 / CDC B-1940 / NIH 8579) TaxID=1442370 RepID=A0A0D2HR55_CLAB1|nr:uncharacterized protein Z519_05935 [Cladophialophora bantiana CBS 173.52]KIW93330.1 hypothetical protein Z519_05935 [Cladophialophora bantiana CBS 173.52]